ncbi:MAG: hypothetical protein R2932_41535 [Caldilineaceae bacterium]
MPPLINYIILVRDLYPLQWMLGLVFMTMFFDLSDCADNLCGIHQLWRRSSIDQTTNGRADRKERFVPEGGSAYSWTRLYRR